MDIKSLAGRFSLWNGAVQDFSKESVDRFSEENLIEEAHQELVQAQNLFSRVEDPDMIDYAIYSMKAAEERFDYLVKAIKTRKRSEVPSPT